MGMDLPGDPNLPYRRCNLVYPRVIDVYEFNGTNGAVWGGLCAELSTNSGYQNSPGYFSGKLSGKLREVFEFSGK